jgi:hypothetical protein
MTVYIPCYFDNNTEREIRVNLVIKAYSQLFENVVILWMNKSLPPYYNNVCYINSPKVSAPKARNILLDIFYNSTQEYCILSDDDTLVLDLSIVAIKGDCVSFVNDKYIHNTNAYFISSAILKLKNFKLKYNKVFYFDETLEIAQDLDFGLQLYKQDIYGVRYTTKSVEIYNGISVLCPSKLKRRNKYQETIKHLQLKHNIIIPY